MSDSNDPRGSTWRKWDLHVHTPCSYTHEYGGSDEPAWQRFLDDLEKLPPEIAVLGVNDYLTIDGYSRLLDEHRRGRLQNIKLLLPVIELRLDKFGGTAGSLSRVNFHVIFSDELTPQLIQEQFLNLLVKEYELAPGKKWRAAPSRQSIEDLGRMIIENVPEDQREKFKSPLHEGYANLNFSLDQVRDALDNSYLRGKFFTAVGKTEWWDIKWNDQSIAEKRTIIESADFVFIAASSPDHCGKAVEALMKSGVNSRLLDCSDAHAYSNAEHKDRIGNTFSWIKADPTFEGLRQVRHAPRERIYFGEIPPKLRLVNENRTRFIRQVRIKRKDDAALSEVWFDNEVTLNHDLVAIIGNKGMGKSALTDIIALTTNADAPPSAYAFLHEGRFRERPDVKARYFFGEVVWESDDTQRRGLEENVPTGTVPQVRYIPQNYFETLCNETKNAEQLQQELRKVIFSNLSEVERGRFGSLDQLIADRTAEAEHRIEELRGEVRSVNQEIASIERELSAAKVKELTDLLQQQETALAAHDKNRPTVVEKPAAAQDTGALDAARAQLEKIEQVSAEEKRALQELHEVRAAVDSVNTRLRTLEEAIERAREATGEDLTLIGLTFADVFKGGPDPTPLVRRRNEVDVQITSKDTLLNGVGGLASQAASVLQSIAELQQALDAPTLEYQRYLDANLRWEQQRNELVGSSELSGSIEFYKARLSVGHDAYVADLAKLRTRQLDLVASIHTQQIEISSFLKTLYGAVETRLAEYPQILDQLKINFDARLVDTGLPAKFMAVVNRARVGAFSEETAMRDLVADYDFNDTADLKRFLDDVWERLHQDARGGVADIDAVQRQLRAQAKPEDVYNLLFELAYLSPKYALRVRSRELHQLTPGERGSLLLVFYLLIDRDPRPLVIDQPEENLDNQSVYELLVPCIAEAKTRRQIIMVTHNPNLAVVCNAEQVVWCKIDKDGDHRVTYESGSLENPITKEHVVDVLEGTWPAFANRGDKYRNRDLLT